MHVCQDYHSGGGAAPPPRDLHENRPPRPEAMKKISKVSFFECWSQLILLSLPLSPSPLNILASDVCFCRAGLYFSLLEYFYFPGYFLFPPACLNILPAWIFFLISVFLQSLGLGSSTYSGVKKVDLDRWTERCRKVR